MNNLRIGMVVVCNKSSSFTDGSKHIKGKKYVITKDTIDYYMVMKDEYII